MKLLTIVTALLVLTLTGSPAAAETEIEEAPLTWEQAALGDGQALFVELCAACHGVGGKGDGPAAPALAAELSDLTMLAAGNDGVFPGNRVEKMITGSEPVTAHGTLEMPVWGRAFEDARIERKPGERWAFSRSRITYLTEYLKSIQVE